MEALHFACENEKDDVNALYKSILGEQTGVEETGLVVSYCSYYFC
jgi:hypothetical protein